MKFLYYSPVSWPHAGPDRLTFPHSNVHFDSKKGVLLYRDSLRLFRLAEDCGFDWLGVGEEHMNAFGVVANPCLICAALATMTNYAMLCIMGNPLPLLSPLRVAEEYAMVDLLSGGRLIAGFPRGVPQNYKAYGASIEGSKERLSEAIDFVLKAWRHQGPFDWLGTHYDFKGVSIWPQPTRQPDLLLSSKSPESVSLAVKHHAVMAEVYVKNRAVLDHFISNTNRYRAEAAIAGWAPASDRFLLSVPCVIARTQEVAYARAERASKYARDVIAGSFEAEKQTLQESYYKGVPTLSSTEPEALLDRIRYGGIICGEPSAVRDQIQALVESSAVGALGLQMHWGNLTPDEVQESLELFGRYVRHAVQ